MLSEQLQESGKNITLFLQIYVIFKYILHSGKHITETATHFLSSYLLRARRLPQKMLLYRFHSLPAK